MSEVFWSVGEHGFGPYRLEHGHLVQSEGEPTKTLAPGFVDIHIHGGFGIDFMTASTAEVAYLAEKLESVGYEYWLPTTITHPVEDTVAAVHRIPEHRSIAGFHLEGPFLSPKHPGAQPAESIIEPPVGVSAWDELFDHPNLRLITMAPERPGVSTLAMRLTQRGVVCSMGHTDATYAEADAGVAAGFRHTTHTYNAMRGLHHREPGTVGAALAHPGLTPELIYDRVHVAPPAAQVLVQCKPSFIAVSDATAAAGLPAGTVLNMWGHDCVVGDKEVRLSASGALAGSAITLLDAFQNLAADFGLEVAIRGTSLNARRALALPEPKLWLVMNQYAELEDIIRVS